MKTFEKPQWPCMDCGSDTYASEEYYSLRDEVWALINPGIDGKLCLECAEIRLGRSLTPEDFTNDPINEAQARLCPSLARRLHRLV
jgi:hypothetical protein